MAILVKNLKKKVLENAKESDQIIIITGYFSPDMIDEIAKMGVPFVYYYGMYGIDKIAKPVYDKLISINNSNSNLKLKFVHTQRVHTKCYLFYNANYVQTECQFRYCGTAIPFLTVRSTAR